MDWADEVWIVDFGDPFPGEPADRRPAVVLARREAFALDLPSAILVPGTTRRRGLEFHVEVEPDEVNGLAATTYLQCELVRAVSRKRLVNRLGHPSLETSSRLREAIDLLVGFS